ncbi:putative pumilio homolog 8, chloroplastic [Coffea eugenioides]|uniref:putative pumilio homolog 8, chloroplastic n=1 Tax=Coffea eugenioides TaxID=49369 RepID=UPI000F613634|nr:putative pumilio homolog 8, chloroplastic [Coffea eugenioides]
MDSSTSATSHTRRKSVNDMTNKENPTNVHEDITTICFGSLCLNSNSNVSTDAASSPSPPVPDSSEKLQETQAVNEARKGLSSNFDNLRAIQEFFPGGTKWLLSGSVPRKNIWACHSLYNREQNPAKNRITGQGNSVTSLNYAHVNYVQDNSYGSLGDQTRFNLFHENSPLYRSPNQFGGLCNMGDNGLNGTGNFRPVTENQFSGNIGSGYNNRMGGYKAISPYFQDQSIWGHGSLVESSLPGFDFFAMAMNREGSEQLKRILRQGNSWYTQETFKAVFPHIFQLMNDSNGHVIFDTLVDKCESCQLCAIVMKFQWETDLFLDSTFNDIASRSIQRLIKKLKKTGLESIITAMLSRRCLELMTHKTASHVIQHSFTYLGDEANEVLYDHILSYFLLLATDRVGCITVNACIDSITGPRRAALLKLVADNASYLSNDPSGNYVLQRVLGLKVDPVTQQICYSLRGQYVELAQRKSGSHVVEKCLESSELGLSLVIKEIFNNDKTLRLLARDQFGNYVIQTALRIAKLHARHLYESMVEALKPHYANLMNKPRGRYVSNLIKADLEVQQSAKSDQ